MSHRLARRQSVARAALEFAADLPVARTERGASACPVIWSSCRQVVLGLAGFLGLRAALVLLRGTGLIAIGRPAGAAAISSGSGPDLN